MTCPQHRSFLEMPACELDSYRQAALGEAGAEGQRRATNLPVVGSDRRLVGTLDIRDALSAILKSEESQEEALINYIAGNGYH